MIAGALDCSEESGHAVRSGSAVMGLLLNPPPEHISYTCSHKQCSKKKKKKKCALGHQPENVWMIFSLRFSPNSSAAR